MTPAPASDADMGPATTERAPRKFLSLKWKALILTSLLLIGIAALLALLSYWSLWRQFDIQRDAAYQQAVFGVEGLVERSSQRLQQFGEMIPGLTGMQPSLVAGDVAKLREAFDRHWPSFQIELGIELVQFYSKKNELLASWGESNNDEPVSGRVMGLVGYVNEREHPFSILDCSENCMQYSLVPILADGQSVGVVLLGHSFADVVLGFKQVSGTDIGMVIVADQGLPDGAGTPERWLPNWNAYVVALTGATHTLPLLLASADRTPRLEGVVSGILTEFEGSDYELRLIPLRDMLHAGDANLVIITDITEDVARIHAATRKSLVTGGVGLFIAEGLLLAFLWTPMSRLRQTALSLPLLSRSRFNEARSAVTVQGDRHRLDDETDVLGNTLVTLSHQLETLERDSMRNTRALAQRAYELSLQKDFVTSLVDTAQAIIITQNGHGEITMVNKYGETLLGYREEVLKGLPFTHVIMRENLTTEVYRDLADLAAGRREHLRQELTIMCNDDTPRHIVWYHSRPPRHGDVGSAILSVGHDITERKLAESRLSWLAEHDPLTGLFNRRRFQSDLEQASGGAKRHDRAGALLFMDLDQFKDVNDSSGHQMGDVLLKDVGDALGRLMRDGDMVARIGGDEFAILVRETGAEGAVEVARQVEEQLRSISLPVGGRLVRVSASIGIALFPQHGENTRDLLANADLAMYQAKESGRGCWHMFSSSEQVRERVQERLFWKSRIEQALANEDFMLYYQPIVDLRSGAVTHFEALIRLQNDDGTVVAPGMFIGVAEATGMIHPIDRWVVKAAARQLAGLVHEGYDVNFSVNLSAHAFKDLDLFAVVKDALAAAAVDPARLIFEVTETAAVADFAAARACIEAIKALGCRFALDDFGVGFSSFFSLKQMPVDFVKIDGSFISHLHENTDDQILVRALTTVAQGFEKITVAEFVETAPTLELLRRYGVDYAQGYLLGKPLPPREAFAALVKPRAPQLTLHQRAIS